MLALFYSLYTALFTGVWNTPNYQDMGLDIQDAWIGLTNWLMNTLGGNFATQQTFEWHTDPITLVCLVLSFCTLVGICLGVCKLVKAVFSIFFRGL